MTSDDEAPPPPHDPHAWLANERLTAYIKQLLVQTGLPLEQRVAHTCRRFRGWDGQGIDNLLRSSDRFLYRDPTTNVLREIDQRLSVQTYAAPGDWADWEGQTAVADNENQEQLVSIECEVFIECKHRDGVAFFGFPDLPGRDASPLPPLLSGFAGTTVLRGTEKLAPPWFTDHPACTIGILGNMQHVLSDPTDQLAGSAKGPKGAEPAGKQKGGDAKKGCEYF